MTKKQEDFEVFKEETIGLFDGIIPSLTWKKEHLIDQNILKENKYPYHIVNNHFSFSSANILLANEINKYERILTPKQQYDFWYYVLDTKKRFDKWVKPKENENLELVKEYYGCSELKAKQYLKIFSEDKIKTIKERLGKS